MTHIDEVRIGEDHVMVFAWDEFVTYIHESNKFAVVSCSSKYKTLPEWLKKEMRAAAKKSISKRKPLTSEDLRSPRNIDKKFPVMTNGKYGYLIEEIVNRVSVCFRQLKRQRSESGSLDLFQSPNKEISPKETDIFMTAQNQAFAELGFYGKSWEWKSVRSAISKEMWRRRKKRELEKRRRVVNEAQKVDEQHQLPVEAS